MKREGLETEVVDGEGDGVEVDVFGFIEEGNAESGLGDAVDGSWDAIGVCEDGLKGIRREEGSGSTDEGETVGDIGGREVSVEGGESDAEDDPLVEGLVDAESEAGLKLRLTCQKEHGGVGVIGVDIEKKAKLIEEGAMEKMSFVQDEYGSNFAGRGQGEKALLDLSGELDFGGGRFDVEAIGDGPVEVEDGAGGLGDVDGGELGFSKIVDQSANEGRFACADRSKEAGNASGVSDEAEALESLFELRIDEVIVWINVRGEGESFEAKEGINPRGKLRHHRLLVF